MGARRVSSAKDDAMPGPTDQLRLPLQRDRPAGATAFVVSDSNGAAVAALADWPRQPGERRGPPSARR